MRFLSAVAVGVLLIGGEAFAQQQPELPAIAQACVQQWQRAAGESMDFQAQTIELKKQIAALQAQLAAKDKPPETAPTAEPKG